MSLGNWTFIDTCGCMTVQEMNNTFSTNYIFCPYCGEKLERGEY